MRVKPCSIIIIILLLLGKKGKFTVFLNCLHTFSESMPHILRTLYTQIQKNTHNGQNPSILLQNETLHSKQCYFFSKWDFVFKWHPVDLLHPEMISAQDTVQC